MKENKPGQDTGKTWEQNKQQKEATPQRRGGAKTESWNTIEEKESW